MRTDICLALLPAVLFEVHLSIDTNMTTTHCSSSMIYHISLCVSQVDARHLYDVKLSKPETWTWADATAGLVTGIQIVGAFCLGEIIGRYSVAGYDTGDAHGH